MVLLQRSLDDAATTVCGRCSVCLGALPKPLAAHPEPDTVSAARLLLRGDDHVVEPRKMWPGGAFGARGRIPVGLAATAGRAVVYADAPEWREVVAAAFGDAGAPGDPGASGEPAAASHPPQLPAELVDGCIQVLVRWRPHWPARPSRVLGLAAAGHRRLVAELAEHIGSVGQLPHRTWAPATRVEERRTSGGDEAAAWRAALPVDDNLRDYVDGHAVLLLVDRTATGWPVTVAAAALREAGATAVLPLVVHRTP